MEAMILAGSPSNFAKQNFRAERLYRPSARSFSDRSRKP
jgi:hypothetical protein